MDYTLAVCFLGLTSMVGIEALVLGYKNKVSKYGPGELGIGYDNGRETKGGYLSANVISRTHGKTFAKTKHVMEDRKVFEETPFKKNVYSSHGVKSLRKKGGDSVRIGRIGYGGKGSVGFTGARRRGVRLGRKKVIGKRKHFGTRRLGKRNGKTKLY